VRQRHAAQRHHGHGEHHLHQPQPKHLLAHGQQLGQAEFEPDGKHQKHHPKLAQVAHALGVLRQRHGVGANQHARGQIAQHGRQLETATGNHAQHCGQQIKQSQSK
jgi:hypothetical protein